MTTKLKRRDVLAGGGALAAAWPALAQTPTDGLIQVVLQTDAGDIVLGLEVVKAPITTTNFLHYVDQKRYDNGTIYRAMHSDTPGIPDWGIVQGGVDPKKGRFPGIAHEPTTQTGLSNKAGAISIARNAPGSATSDFFICVGDMTSFDADPKADGDNLGFAAFGHVVSGMDVVKKDQLMPTQEDAQVAAMKGQMLVTPVKILSAKRA